jgi:uncharacterized membrane protein
MAQSYTAWLHHKTDRATGVMSLVVVILLFRRGATAAAWLALAGSLALVGVIAVTLAVEVPIDNKIRTWTTGTLPTDWEQIQSRWANFHTVRTFLSLAGLAVAVGAALATTPRLFSLRSPR